MPSSDEIAQRFTLVSKRVAEICAENKRRPESVEIMVVSKTRGIDEVRRALASGAGLFGENRVQEALEKFGPTSDWNNEAPVHLIGNLQKNKARKAARFFSCIQSIDDDETLRLVADEAEIQGRHIDVCLEFNSSGEEQKHGCRTERDILRLLELAMSLPRIEPRGLMTVGPLSEDESAVRKAFEETRRLFESCAKRFTPPKWNVLSMGMSGDYAAAIAEGSTMIRIGSAIFGERPAAR